jgi:hypothetical protein
MPDLPARQHAPAGHPPGERRLAGPSRVPGIAGRPGRGRLLGRGHGPHPVDRAGQGELRRAEPFHEVPAPALPCLLHGPQDRVQRTESTGNALGHH